MTRVDGHDRGGHDGGAVRRRFRIVGIVQGVGFRPFVHEAATRLGLGGWVANGPAGVIGEVEGAHVDVAHFLRVISRGPASADIHGVEIDHLGHGPVDPTAPVVFAIRSSEQAVDGAAGSPRLAMAPDRAVCGDCLSELGDPSNRRHRDPFVSCTACGPRLTISWRAPYDRGSTTMSAFAPCPLCRSEYDDPENRRFHHQAICCPACGPRLAIVDPSGAALPGEPIAVAARLLRDGGIVAVKGLGGYHLAVDATDEAAVARLRSAKHRPDQPMAVMVRDLHAARKVALVSTAEAHLLESPAAPIVLVGARARPTLAPGVSRGAMSVGVMIAYTPLHLLLMEAVGGPIVLTSGNASGEPIVVDDDIALRRLGPMVDALVVHDRTIVERVDDSVMRMIGTVATVLRRSRGFVPRGIRLATAADAAMLGCGGEAKSTVCASTDGEAVVSQHLGDLDHPDTVEAFEAVADRLQDLLGRRATVVAHDLHPGYRATAFATGLAGVELVGVQHHHAHVAACMAENGELGPVLGVAFDGLGWGPDGTAWGGEILEADLHDFTRVASIDPVSMPGGVSAIREPWRMAAAHLTAAGVDTTGLGVRDRNLPAWDDVVELARTGVASPATTSVGRLFDAVASLVAGVDRVTFEGQAAMALEQLAAAAATDDSAGGYRARVVRSEGIVRMAVGDLVSAIVEDLRVGVSPGVIADRFQRGLVDATVRVLRGLRGTSGLSTVALSGGVFQNAALTSRMTAELESAGFVVLRHHLLPPNDGCLSYGQVSVAAARRVATHGSHDEGPPCPPLPRRP